MSYNYQQALRQLATKFKTTNNTLRLIAQKKNLLSVILLVHHYPQRYKIGALSIEAIQQQLYVA